MTHSIDTSPLPAPESAGDAPRRYFVTSFGCQMNVYDGERMGEMLAAQGMTQAQSRDEADLVILNTCHIREKAVARVYSDIGRLKREDGSKPMIAVAGCVAQAEGEEIARRARSVDIVVGPQAYHRLPQLIDQARRGETAIDTDMPVAAKFGALPGRARQQRPSAFLTVQEGCDKFCTYCVVPYTRGAEISRPYADLVGEARALVEAGVKEITLLGQNVNAWTGEDDQGRARGLEGLIEALADMTGLERIRYTTSHPNDMTDALIAAHRDIPKLMPYLHLPVQAGSDRILKAMNRSHTAASYLKLIERIRAARPDIAMSAISSSAFRERPRPISRRRSISCATRFTRRRSASNIRPAPAPPPPTWRIRSPPRSWTSGCSACRTCSIPSSTRSTSIPSASA